MIYSYRLSLPLLVARIAAHDEHHPAAADDFALVTYSLDAGFDFHGSHAAQAAESPQESPDNWR
jgi:hypothetical protein